MQIRRMEKKRRGREKRRTERGNLPRMRGHRVSLSHTFKSPPTIASPLPSNTHSHRCSIYMGKMGRTNQEIN
jgi:hypothetical protein